MDINQLIADNGACFYVDRFRLDLSRRRDHDPVCRVRRGAGSDRSVLLLIGGLARQLRRRPVLFLARPAVSASGCSTGSRAGATASMPRCHWLERYDTGFILSFRFIYGVRNFSSFALGLSAVHWERFLRLNFLAAGLWAATFVAAGYLPRPRLPRGARRHRPLVQARHARRLCRDRRRHMAAAPDAAAAPAASVAAGRQGRSLPPS